MNQIEPNTYTQCFTLKGAALGGGTTSEGKVDEGKETTANSVSATTTTASSSAFQEVGLSGDAEPEVDVGDWVEVDKRSVADDDKNCQAAAKSSVMSTVLGWFR